MTRLSSVELAFRTGWVTAADDVSAPDVFPDAASGLGEPQTLPDAVDTGNETPTANTATPATIRFMNIRRFRLVVSKPDSALRQTDKNGLNHERPANARSGVTTTHSGEFRPPRVWALALGRIRRGASVLVPRTAGRMQSP